MSTEPLVQPAFDLHFEETYRGLCGALTELVLSVQADPAKPQEISRRFGIDKTLAWKISKLIMERDPYTSVRHIPGAPGVEILLGKLGEAGATPERLEAVRQARLAFERMVEIQAGDRATFELMLRSMAPEEERTARQADSRKLSFQGNSATWGVQARRRLSTRLLVPNAQDPARVDLATLSGFVDFRRLRPTAWPLVHMQFFGEADAESEVVPLFPGPEPDSILVSEFCSQPVPLVQALPEGGETLYELAEGPVGNPRAVTCILGWLRRSFAPIHSDEDDGVGEHILALDTPAENLQFDIFFHRELPFPDPPQAAFYSLMEGRPQFPLTQQRRYRLGLPVEIRDLGQGPPQVTGPDLPRYRELLEQTCERMGHALEDFRGFRLELRYPPTPTLAVLYHGLPRA